MGVKFWRLVRKEPVMFQGVLQASIALLAAFGMSMSVEQVGAVLAFTAAVLTFVTRSQVTPVADPRMGGRPAPVPDEPRQRRAA